VELVRHSDWLRASAELAIQIGHKAPWQRWLQTKTGSNLAAWYSYLTRQADCIQAVASKCGERV
jgi:hypothetical protein